MYALQFNKPFKYRISYNAVTYIYHLVNTKTFYILNIRSIFFFFILYKVTL